MHKKENKIGKELEYKNQNRHSKYLKNILLFPW